MSETSTFMNWFMEFDFQETISSFLTMFAVIDITGSIPIILSLRSKGRDVKATKAVCISAVLLLCFFYCGTMLLDLFHVDIHSFATAGAFILFLMALEMILDVEIFKNQGPMQEATLIPLVFPLIAGPASFTTLLSLSSIYADINILISLVLNLIFVYFVLSMTSTVERILGKSGIYVSRKFFGIILLAVSVGMFIDNITKLVSTISGNCN